MDTHKNLFPLLTTIFLVGICSCDAEDVEQPYDQELEVIDEDESIENPDPGLGEIDSTEPETAEVEVEGDPRQADFNCDGIADLAIGVPEEDIGAIVSGAVNVLYGSEDGLTTEDNQVWHHDNIDTGGAATVDEGDQFGAALAAGDFNDDGCSDLAIGAPGDDVTVGIVEFADAGSVTILYGSPDGLTDDDAQYWHQDSEPLIQGGVEAGDNFGFALTAGNFGRDSADDLAIGVPYEDIGSLAAGVDAGAVNVIFGVDMVGLTEANNQLLYQDVGLTGEVSEAGDHLGWALAAGDFDDNTYDDLAIGVPGEDLVGETEDDAGLVHVVDGTALGLTTSEIWHQGIASIEGDPEAGDEFGRALAAGDFNNNDADDLAVGVPFEDVGASDDAGAVNVIYGVPMTGLAAAGDQIWHQDSPNIEGSTDDGDLFGYALATGNFDGDSREDLAVGSPGEDLGSDDEDAGAVNVIYGTSNATGLGSSGDQRWNQDTSGIRDFAEEGDAFGFALTSGNYDGDSDETSDLAIGVPFEDVEDIEDAGAVNVIYGDDDGLDDDDDQFWHQDSEDDFGEVEGAAEEGNLFGSAVR